MKKIKTNFKKKTNKDDQWRFDFEDENANVFPPVIKRNQLVEIETDTWDVPVQAVKLSNFRALAFNDTDDHFEVVQEWPGLYVALAGAGSTHLTLDVPSNPDNDPFLPGGGRADDHRLIEFSAEIFMPDGKIVEVDPILDERPGG